jgi:hypothetical protein
MFTQKQYNLSILEEQRDRLISLEQYNHYLVKIIQTCCRCCCKKKSSKPNELRGFEIGVGKLGMTTMLMNVGDVLRQLMIASKIGSVQQHKHQIEAR